MNSPVAGLLAALTLDFPKQERSMGKVPGLLFSDVLIIIAVGLVLLVLLATAFYLWMKPRRKRRKHLPGGQKVFSDTEEKAEQAPSDDEQEEEDSEEENEDHRQHGRRRYKYRVRRRTHRSRNPTLSEVGGLPPVKPPEPGKPC